MKHTRIAPVEPPYAEEIAEQLTRMMPPGLEPIKLFRTVAHNPRLLQKMWASNLLDKGSITLRERELVILRTCARCGAEYEWGVHVAYFGQRAQLTDEEAAATVHGSPASSVWSESESLLIGLVDELHETNRVSDGLWDAAAAYWCPDQLLEIIMLIGLYHTVSFLINGVQIEPEEFAPCFP